MIRPELQRRTRSKHNKARQQALNALRKQHKNEWLAEYRKAEQNFLNAYVFEYRKLKVMFLDDLNIDEQFIDHRRDRVVSANISERRNGCPTCGAAQWKPCRRPSGAWARTHAARQALDVVWMNPLDRFCPKCLQPSGFACKNLKSGKTHAPHKERRTS